MERRSEVPAPAGEIWARVSRMDGVNDEFRPWMRMTVPRALRGASLDDLPLGVLAGRSWLLLFGLVPFDYDDLVIAEREPGRRFLERSTMLSMRRWEHERILKPCDAGTGTGGRTVVHDRIVFELRRPLALVPGLGAVVASVVSGLFAHRHRRLERAFRSSREGDERPSN
ncbi:hypothetical protein I6A84_32725 [Frankia sp. CNm7]|uniref:Ligand-binding SRPBCC domain-containing protein n=1 Tax=Frankia nepalensis TaxID=1836974 RepID=A0A937RG59_9ACTN|nr:hypothetical protein [Frankia nepalensis]MBL7509184.1 hypothetical protein [Frankia nepalensis]MBL7522722.1 hypothetical protein [Frankia nepalensis]MBL7628375.1 hypothetical protein [Frankia nepalensis]